MASALATSAFAASAFAAATLAASAFAASTFDASALADSNFAASPTATLALAASALRASDDLAAGGVTGGRAVGTGVCAVLTTLTLAAACAGTTGFNWARCASSTGVPGLRANWAC